MPYRQSFLVLVGAIWLLVGCTAADPSTKVQPMQRKDKRLSCKEILLEMNEAEFYRQMAYKNKGPKIKNMLMPLGYISTYMDAEEAIEAAEARVSYLDRVYEIMRCEDQEARLNSSPKVSQSFPDEAINPVSASGNTQYYSPYDR